MGLGSQASREWGCRRRRWDLISDRDESMKTKKLEKVEKGSDLGVAEDGYLSNGLKKVESDVSDDGFGFTSWDDEFKKPKIYAIDVAEDRDVEVEFLHSVKWTPTITPFEKRMEKYSQSSSLPRHLEIHWLSIINSCVTLLLLTGFLATILMRVLKNYFVKYAHDDETADDQEETG